LCSMGNIGKIIGTLNSVQAAPILAFWPALNGRIGPKRKKN
jgi:hypothetical protein